MGYSLHPIKVKENVSVGSATHLLLRYRINGILVTKEDDDSQLAGIYTTNDALRLIEEAFSKDGERNRELTRLGNIAVGDVASRHVHSLQVDESLDKAIAMMRQENVHTIPVFEGDKLVGVLGRHDLLNAALYSG